MNPYALMVISLIVLLGCVEPDQDYAVLTETEGRKLIQHCSRNAPKVKGVWIPEREQVEAAEKQLGQIRDMRDQLDPRRVINDPSEYYRQYFGWILEDGTQHLYVNAIRKDSTQMLDGNWQDNAMELCDGQTVSWGALYDIATGTFQSLNINY